MASYVKCLLFIFSLIFVTKADDRVHFNDEHEKRWNTPPELTPEQVTRKKAETINARTEARFLPFSASFNINAGQDNSEGLQLGAGLGGISVSQSSSFSQAATNSFGNTGSSLSASQSSSFAAGLGGISSSDSNSFNVNHPVFGGQSNSNSHSFSVGHASSSSQANAGHNGQASSGSQASVGSVHSSASSGSNVQVLSDGLILGQPQGPRKPVWTNIGPNHDFPGHPISNRPTLTIQKKPIVINERPITVTLDDYGSRWQQNRPQHGGNEWRPNEGINFQGHRWRPHSKHEYAQGYPSIPNSWSQGQGQSSGGLQIAISAANSGASSNSGSHAQGFATSVHRNPYGRTEGKFGNVNFMNQQGEPSVDFVKFPGQTNIQSIPREFVRSKQAFHGKRQREEKDLVESIVSDIKDTVSDLLDIS